VPYRIASLPPRAAVAGLGATVRFLDDQHVISRVQELLGPRTGPFGVLVNVRAGGLTGFGGGVTILHDRFFGATNHMKLRTESTTRGTHKFTLGVRLRQESPDQFELGAGYRVMPNARFFGIGPGAPEANESHFTLEQSWTGGGYTRRVAESFFVDAGVLFSAVGARGSDDEYEPLLSEKFAGALPSGYRDRSDGITVGLGLRHDSAEEDGRPSGGGVQRARVAYFSATDGGNVAYWSTRGEVEQYIPLWLPSRVLALRGYVSWIESTGDDPLPFQRLMTNDDPDLLRGYQDFRWRDRGMTSLSAEYRWPIWASRVPDGLGVDAYLLTDVGQVFGSREEISLDNVTASYGGGVRLIGSDRGFRGRLEYARSDEESVIRLRADQVFQFARHGLYHGRNPIPIR
jgi:outer membrane protein assembly factor BamA